MEVYMAIVRAYEVQAIGNAVNHNIPYCKVIIFTYTTHVSSRPYAGRGT